MRVSVVTVLVSAALSGCSDPDVNSYACQTNTNSVVQFTHDLRDSQGSLNGESVIITEVSRVQPRYDLSSPSNPKFGFFNDRTGELVYRDDQAANARWHHYTTRATCILISNR